MLDLLGLTLWLFPPQIPVYSTKKYLTIYSKYQVSHGIEVSYILGRCCEPNGKRQNGELGHDRELEIGYSVQFSSLSRVRLFATPWITACQASLSITNSRSSPRLTSIESVMPSATHPLSSPSPPAPNPSQRQSFFQWVNSLHEVAKVLELQL